jgi:hypothetical protein
MGTSCCGTFAFHAICPNNFGKEMAGSHDQRVLDILISLLYTQSSLGIGIT